MANQHSKTGRRIGLFLTSGLLLAAVGCGFPHGRYGGDPMLGNFNRPIAQTPPIWTGADSGASPATDGGARMGLPSPDVPIRSQPALERMFIVPTYGGTLGLSKLFGGDSGGGSQRTSGSETPAPAATGLRSSPGTMGAHLLPGASRVTERGPIAPNAVASADSVTPRAHDAHSQFSRGSSIETILPPPQPVSPIVAMKDPLQVLTAQEGQTILTLCGAKGQLMEQQPTGEWIYICTIGNGGDLRRYEAKSADQLEAVRAVMWQVKKDQ